MKYRFFITALMLMASLTMSAQLRTGYQTDSVKNAEFREKIAIDMSVPDFETKKIDGVSNDKSTNEIFCMLCRYFKD